MRSPNPTLCVAATGGHLAQLLRLSVHLLDADARRVWVTFDTPQSRSALAGEDVHFLPYIGPRDVRGVLRGFASAPRLLRHIKPEMILSTGSAVAVPFMVWGRSMGIPCHYIESAARSTGPSLSGKLVSVLPGVQCSTQYSSWAGGRWKQSLSVFDLFRVEMPQDPVPEVKRLVVTLGTIEGYAFDGLITRLLEIVPATVEVFWQLAPKDVGRLDVPGAHGQIPQAVLLQAIGEADAVVAHAGIGSALSALDAGLRPVLVPRRRARGEHIDDHQTQIASELADRRLAVTVDAQELTWDHVLGSACGRVLPV